MEQNTSSHQTLSTSMDVRSKIRALPASNGLSWIKAGWQLFKMAPLHAAVVGLLILLVPVVFSMVPAVGFLLSTLFTPVLTAGGFLVWEGLQRTGKLEIEDYFAGFRLKLESLVIAGLLNLLGVLVLVTVTALVTIVFALLLNAGNSLEDALTTLGLAFTAQNYSEILRSPIVLLGAFAVLFGLGVWVPLFMAQIFAPALIVFYRMSPLNAMKASFFMCLANVTPYLIYGLATLPLGLLAILPLGLGIIPLIAVLSAAQYFAMTDILGEIPNRN